jgi:hypothetical protein
LLQPVVALPQQDVQQRPVERQEVAQPARQIGIAARPTERDAIDQAKRLGRRSPDVTRDPAVHREETHRQTAGIEADPDQMGERLAGAGSAEQMQVAMLHIAAMAVVVALGPADGVDEVTGRIVALGFNRRAAGEEVDQGAVPFGDPQPAAQGAACRSVAREQRGHRSRPADTAHLDGPQPPSAAAQPPL